MPDKIEISREDLQNIIISCISHTDNTRDKADKARIYEDALTEIIVRTLPDRDRAAAQNILFSWLSNAKQIKTIDKIKDLDDDTRALYGLNSRPDGETYKEIVKHMADAIKAETGLLESITPDVMDALTADNFHTAADAIRKARQEEN